MKHRIIFCLFFFLMCLSCMTGCGKKCDITYKYEIVDGGVKITEWEPRKDDMDEIEFPEKIKGKKVICIAESMSYHDRNRTVSSVKIPEGVKEIGYGAFSGYTGLESIELPDSLTKIGDDAFARCTSLSEIELPAGLTEIGKSAFVECTALSHIGIPSSLTKIGAFAFGWCYELESVELPDNVTIIPPDAFVNCYKLKSVKGSGITSIGGWAFKNCFCLGTITFPNVEEIGRWAFDNCLNVTTLSIPSSLTQYNGMTWDYAFNCPNVYQIIIEDGVTEIYDHAFERCSHVQTIRIPNSVRSIGKNSFHYDENTVFEVHKGSWADSWLQEQRFLTGTILNPVYKKLRIKYIE